MLEFAVAAQPLDTADMAVSPAKYYHRFTPTIFFELKAIQTWVVKHGNPPGDPFGLELRSYTPGSEIRILLATSMTTWGINEISSENYACKQVFFEFEKPILLRKGTEYSCNLTIPLYTGTPDNHMAWVRQWPKPLKSFAGDSNPNALGQYPFHVTFIGREARP